MYWAVYEIKLLFTNDVSLADESKTQFHFQFWKKETQVSLSL